MQTGVAEREQATGLASRIVEDIGSYYSVNGYTIEIDRQRQKASQT